MQDGLSIATHVFGICSCSSDHYIVDYATNSWRDTPGILSAVPSLISAGPFAAEQTACTSKLAGERSGDLSPPGNSVAVNVPLYASHFLFTDTWSITVRNARAYATCPYSISICVSIV